MDIKLNVKLTAYTKYTQPDLTDYVLDAPDDNHLYARKDREWVDIGAPVDGRVYALQNGEWVNISDAVERDHIIGRENSGLYIYYDAENYTYIIGVKQENLLETELPLVLADDTVYYVESCSAEEYFWGGTAWSWGNNEYVTYPENEVVIDGGSALTLDEDVERINGVNSKGVYDEGKN